MSDKDKTVVTSHRGILTGGQKPKSEIRIEQVTNKTIKSAIWCVQDHIPDELAGKDNNLESGDSMYYIARNGNVFVAVENSAEDPNKSFVVGVLELISLEDLTSIRGRSTDFFYMQRDWQLYEFLSRRFKPEDIAVLYAICVSENYRKQGIGKQLIEHAAHHSRFGRDGMAVQRNMRFGTEHDALLWALAQGGCLVDTKQHTKYVKDALGEQTSYQIPLGIVVRMPGLRFGEEREAFHLTQSRGEHFSAQEERRMRELIQGGYAGTSYNPQTKEIEFRKLALEQAVR